MPTQTNQNIYTHTQKPFRIHHELYEEENSDDRRFQQVQAFRIAVLNELYKRQRRKSQSSQTSSFSDFL